MSAAILHFPSPGDSLSRAAGMVEALGWRWSVGSASAYGPAAYEAFVHHDGVCSLGEGVTPDLALIGAYRKAVSRPAQAARRTSTHPEGA